MTELGQGPCAQGHTLELLAGSGALPTQPPTLFLKGRSCTYSQLQKTLNDPGVVHVLKREPFLNLLNQPRLKDAGGQRSSGSSPPFWHNLPFQAGLGGHHAHPPWLLPSNGWGQRAGPEEGN